MLEAPAALDPVVVLAAAEVAAPSPDQAAKSWVTVGSFESPRDDASFGVRAKLGLSIDEMAEELMLDELEALDVDPEVAELDVAEPLAEGLDAVLPIAPGTQSVGPHISVVTTWAKTEGTKSARLPAAANAMSAVFFRFFGFSSGS